METRKITALIKPDEQGNRIRLSQNVIGYAGEHLATEILFVLPQEWEHAGTNYFVSFLTGEGKAYKTAPQAAPVTVKLPAAVTVKGRLTIQLTAIPSGAGTELAALKTACCQAEIGQSVSGEAGPVPSDPTAGMIEQSLKDFAQATAQLEAAAEFLPVIGENGNWFVYDIAQEKYTDTGKPSRGVPGPQGIQGLQGVKGDKGDMGELTAESVTVPKLSKYIQNTLLNRDNLFLDPLMENSAVNWKPGAYNKGVIVHGNNQIIIDGRAEGKRYSTFATEFNIPSPDGYVLEAEIMLLDDTFPTSYPVYMCLIDSGNTNIWNKTLYPTANQLKLNQWFKLRTTVPAAAGAVKFKISFGISDTGGCLAYRRPKLVKGTDTSIFSTFNFDITDRVQAISDKADATAAQTGPLFKKSVLFAGDSVVENADSYAKTIPAKYSMTVKDLSVAGLNLARTSSADAWNILGRVAGNMQTDSTQYDYIILEGGINDSFNCPLGEITQDFAAVPDETTYCGALESLIKQCLKFYMGKRVGFVITHQLGNAGYNTKLGTYFDKARLICGKYSVPYLDLYRTSGLCCALPEVMSALFTDAIHPKTAGHALITSKVDAWMKTL